jgi:hypothetical protein
LSCSKGGGRKRGIERRDWREKGANLRGHFKHSNQMEITIKSSLLAHGTSGRLGTRKPLEKGCDPTEEPKLLCTETLNGLVFGAWKDQEEITSSSNTRADWD